MLQRSKPSVLDTDYLRAQQIAPGNEYKVMGALRFLGIVDDEGRPSDQSRYLQAEGEPLAQFLRLTLRAAYADLFASVDIVTATRQDIYNHFVIHAGLGREMATKAARTFLELCRHTKIGLSPELGERPRRGRPAKDQSAGESPQYRERPQSGKKLRESRPEAVVTADTPFLLAITPEMAALDQDQLTDLFRKLRIALERSAIQ